MDGIIKRKCPQCKSGDYRVKMGGWKTIFNSQNGQQIKMRDIYAICRSCKNKWSIGLETTPFCWDNEISAPHGISKR